jgi:hypothetical protein
MLSLISGYYVIRVAMLGVGLGFSLVWGVAGAQAVEQEDDFFATKLKLLRTQFVDSRADLPRDDRFGASVVLVRPADTISLGAGSPDLPLAAKPQQEPYGTMNASWRQAYDGDRGSLSRLLRLEFRTGPAKIALRPHSVSIRGERLNFQLKSNLVSMLWSKKF